MRSLKYGSVLLMLALGVFAASPRSRNTIGPTGNTGATGAAGPAGDAGATGAAGPAGDAGVEAAVFVGDKTVQGDAGITGSFSVVGSAGSNVTGFEVLKGTSVGMFNGGGDGVFVYQGDNHVYIGYPVIHYGSGPFTVLDTLQIIKVASVLTCDATTEGSMVPMKGGAGEGYSKMCFCISDGGGSPAYQWCSMQFGVGVTTTTCAGGSATVCP